MNSELIFYLAKKTSLCEKILRKSLGNFNVNLSNTTFATNPQTLGTKLCENFDECNLFFIVGGLEFSDRTGIKNIFSKAFAYESLDDMKKIENANGYQDGFLFRKGNQLILVFPDEPADIEAMLKEPLKSYIISFCENN